MEVPETAEIQGQTRSNEMSGFMDSVV